jgi:hypothetical protein
MPGGRPALLHWSISRTDLFQNRPVSVTDPDPLLQQNEPQTFPSYAIWFHKRFKLADFCELG